MGGTSSTGRRAAVVGCILVVLPILLSSFFPQGLLHLPDKFSSPSFPFYLNLNPSASTKNLVCESPAYHTEIVSLDPLLIYIHSFLREDEIKALLATAEPLFKPSQVAKSGKKVATSDRTSSSAGLPLHDPVVQCVLARARGFMGTMMVEGEDEMGPPQLVRYEAAQRFNIHHDWYDTPQWAYDGSRRKFNRIASFFAVLQDNCTSGETYFPYIGERPAPDGDFAGTIQGADPGRTWRDSDPVWREHEDGGIAFRPVKGNALFWVNLHADGSGDERTMHAGLRVGEGLKTAMNIWPRHFYPLG